MPKYDQTLFTDTHIISPLCSFIQLGLMQTTLKALKNRNVSMPFDNFRHVDNKSRPHYQYSMCIYMSIL